MCWKYRKTGMVPTVFAHRFLARCRSRSTSRVRVGVVLYAYTAEVTVVGR